jgi:membrane protease YdiL (CAAX protease family)
LQEQRPEQHDLRPGGAFLLVLIQFGALMTVWIIGANIAGGDGEEQSGLAGLVFLAAGTVVAPLVALYVGLNRYTPQTPTAQALGLRKPLGRQWALIVVAAGTGAALGPVINDVTVRMVMWFELDLGGERPDERTRFLLDVISVGAAPIAIELFFRGFLQGRLRQSVGAMRAYWVTLILYTVSWVNPLRFPETAIAGGALGFVSMRSGVTWAAIAMHVGIEAVRRFGTPMDPVLQSMSIVAPCGAAAAVGLVVVWWLTRVKTR